MQRSNRRDLRVALCAVGRKGLRVLERVIDVRPPAVVVAYPQDGDADGSFFRMRSLCARADVTFVEDRHLRAQTISDTDLVALVGWQYLLEAIDERVVVFHDSLLPRYRGCAPTVTALIRGESEIGVTAIRPVEAVDAGPVLGQRRWTVEYPITIADALDRQAAVMADLLIDLVESAADGTLRPTPQDETKATYSLWRGDGDAWIDWSWDARRIARFVDAVGAPYCGARTVHDGGVVTVRRVEVADDVAFEDRSPGKIWTLTDQGPVVVCGTGMVRILEALDADGTPVRFTRRRRRLGDAGVSGSVLVR